MHELSQLGKLERKYRRELAVIGVASPKYTAEGDPDNLRRAVQRYGIEHPVVSDPESAVWDAYAVSAWPTLVFLSPTGQVIGRHAGEAHFEALDGVVAQIVEEYRREGSLLPGPLSFAVAPFSRPPSLLSFPGKVLPAGDRVFIADSGHHRIIVADADGRARQIVGSGEAGFVDGSLTSARFDRPQGMALDPSGILYVADSENHAIRAVDFTAEQVTTIAGTGRQAVRRVRSGPAKETDLSSPWDLACADGRLYIAMAGLHQIWALTLDTGTVEVWAGTGHEAIRDGAREQAWLAQPMGLSLDGRTLLVACAEAQAVRAIDLDTDMVGTLAGRGLFDFGDDDGPAAIATLQHCQGVTAAGSTVYVADSYNNKIKAIDRNVSTVSTYLGSGRAGTLDGPGANARFWEPGGIAVEGRTLWIADTDNHLIRISDLDSGHVRTFSLMGHGLDVRGE